MSLKYIARIVAWLRSEYTLLLTVCISVCNDIASVEELRFQWNPGIFDDASKHKDLLVFYLWLCAIKDLIQIDVPRRDIENNNYVCCCYKGARKERPWIEIFENVSGRDDADDNIKNKKGLELFNALIEYDLNDGIGWKNFYIEKLVPKYILVPLNYFFYDTKAAKAEDTDDFTRV